MPWAPAKPCPRCGVVGCVKHQARHHFDQRTTPKRDYGREHVELRDQVFERDGYACVECGATEDLQAGHVDRHGPDVLENYVTQCGRCNRRQAGREAHDSRAGGRGARILPTLAANTGALAKRGRSRNSERKAP